jgi:hypothetical protein
MMALEREIEEPRLTATEAKWQWKNQVLREELPVKLEFHNS